MGKLRKKRGRIRHIINIPELPSRWTGIYPLWSNSDAGLSSKDLAILLRQGSGSLRRDGSVPEALTREGLEKQEVQVVVPMQRVGVAYLHASHEP